jgi:hypothetical protein
VVDGEQPFDAGLPAVELVMLDDYHQGAKRGGMRRWRRTATA